MKKLLATTLTLSLCISSSITSIGCQHTDKQSMKVILLGLDGVTRANLDNYILNYVSQNAGENILTNYDFPTAYNDSGNAWRDIIYGRSYGVTNDDGTPKAPGSDLFSKIHKSNHSTAFYYNWYCMDPNLYELHGTTWGVLDQSVSQSLDDSYDIDENLFDENDSNKKIHVSDLTSDEKFYSKFENNLSDDKRSEDYYKNILEKKVLEPSFVKSKEAINNNTDFIFHYDTTADDLGHGGFVETNQLDDESTDHNKSEVLNNVYKKYAEYLDYYFSLDKEKYAVFVITDHGRFANGIDHFTDDTSDEINETSKFSWVLSNQKFSKDTFNDYGKTTQLINNYLNF